MRTSQYVDAGLAARQSGDCSMVPDLLKMRTSKLVSGLKLLPGICQAILTLIES